MSLLRRYISKEYSEHWRRMNVYEKCEQIIALLLTAVIAAVIVSALFRLIEKVYSLLLVGALDPAEAGRLGRPECRLTIVCLG